jgi:hypothetical protein
MTREELKRKLDEEISSVYVEIVDDYTDEEIETEGERIFRDCLEDWRDYCRD